MPKPRHAAIVAGLTLSLALGSVATPAIAETDGDAPTTDTDPNGMGDPAPADYDKEDYYEGTENVSTFARTRSASTLSAVSLSDEMKYFAKYESNCNYDQGLSYGDGYNAMGYYQLDRRYGLMAFLQQVYAYNPTKYSMLKGVLGKAELISNSAVSMYDYNSRQLTAVAQELNEAWHAAYAADPAEFSALQDSYAYNTYYLPVQSILLNSYGVDIRDRADCVKGLVWGMCNLFGSGGVRNYLNDANISDDMTDRELVTALCDTVIERVTYYCSSQPQYWNGWQSRYRSEKATCLAYIAEDEAEAEKNAVESTKPAETETPSEPTEPEKTETPSESDNTSTKDDPAADDTPATDRSDKDDGTNSEDSADSNASSNSGTGSGSGSNSANESSSGSSDTSSAASKPSGIVARPSVSTDNNSSASSSGSADSSSSSSSTSSADTSTSESVDDTSALKKEENSAEVTEEDSEEETQDLDGNPKTPEPKSTKNPPDKTETNPADNENKDTGAKDDKNKDKKDKKNGLPQTGDIASLVMTGAAGLAVAGGSFLSLGNQERKRADSDKADNDN